MNTPTRRALGRKDTNTHLARPVTHSKLAGSPLKTLTMSAQQRSPPSAGSKRKIEEVEDAERVDHDLDASQRTQLLSDSGSEHGLGEMSGTLRGDTSHETGDTSFAASQQYPASQNVPELHFELPQEEMSQRTREQLGAVPLPQNTSQLPPHHPTLFNEASAGSVGLSTFLNLDDQMSSQASVQDQMVAAEEIKKTKDLEPRTHTIETSEAQIQVDHRTATLERPVTAPLTSDSTRKEAIILAAEQMKARLQLALFKVQSNQTKVPFSRLKRPRPDPTHSSSPHVPAVFAQPQLPIPKTYPHSSSTIKAPSSARTISAPPSSAIEAHVSDLRHHATAQTKPAVPDLSAFPHPVIKPTTFSARWNNVPQGIFQPPTRQPADPKEKDTSDHSSQATQQHFPSSPPLSRHNSSNNTIDLRVEDLDSEGAVHHALIDRARQTDETTHLSSPPESNSEGGPDDDGEKISKAKQTDTKTATAANRDITATAGEAASGLLALMQG